MGAEPGLTLTIYTAEPASPSPPLAGIMGGLRGSRIRGLTAPDRLSPSRRSPFRKRTFWADRNVAHSYRSFRPVLARGTYQKGTLRRVEIRHGGGLQRSFRLRR
jgi:hypothetical protein